MVDNLPPKPETKRLFLGIDLGTATTAVMTSRGHKQVCRSVVGHPVDIIARNLVGKPFVAGNEALEAGGSLALTYPMREGMLDYENPAAVTAAAELLTHVISRAKPKPNEELCGIIAISARPEPAAIKALQEVVRDELHHAALVSAPFLVAFGENNKKLLEASIVIDIGAGAVNLCGVKGGVPGVDDQISFAGGGDNIDTLLRQLIEQRYPGVQLTGDLVRNIKEQHAFVGEADGEIKVELRSGGIPAMYDVTREIRQACESIIPELMDALKELVAGFDLDCLEAALRHIVLSGGGSLIRGLDEMLIREMREYGKVRVSRVNDPFFATCKGALLLADFVPVEEWGRIGLTMAE
ncbi:MAG: rod shape-determining protein [Desulfobulbaceae bacterium]|nr:rod shape-determining protein [Desulfobulbaceae bacterium]HIJ79388.1 hypothetical protein [Deltaproteobacteria bacterium]